MAFHLTTLRYSYAVKAYETHARIAGIPAHRIREAFSRRAQGNWELSDGQRIVAIVTPQTYVRIVTQETP